MLAKAAAPMADRPRSSSSSSRKKVVCASSVGYRAAGSAIRVDSTLVGSITRSARYSDMKLRVIRPAPASSTSVKASSTASRLATSRLGRDPSVADRPPSRRPSMTLLRARCTAGQRPEMAALTTQTITTNKNTRPSIVHRIQYGKSMLASVALNIRVASAASTTPSAPANVVSSTLSMSNCRRTSHRVAPCASRMAVARVRASERANRRLATLTQAMRSTRPAKAISAMRNG